MSEPPFLAGMTWSDESLSQELRYYEMLAETSGPSLHQARQRAREAIHAIKTEIARRRAAAAASQ